MNRTYFNLWFRLGCSDHFLIWYSGRTDGVFVDEKEGVPSFLTLQDAGNFAILHGIVVADEEPILLDLDAVRTWLQSETATVLDCENLLFAWNTFDDISRSCGGRFDSNHKLTNRIYKKLFWGSNLPAITPDGQSYTPVWTKGEIRILRKTLRTGMSFFQRVVKQC